jgi:hypothetical protein
MGPVPTETAILMEPYLLTFDVQDDHEMRVAALRSRDLQRAWIVRALFAIRRLQGRTSPLPSSRAFLAQALAVGWVMLEEVPGRELVAGAVTQPWRPIVTFQGLPPAEFLGFTTPGFTKLVWVIAARPITPDVSVLRVETRVLATDLALRCQFRLYGLVVSSGVRLLRLVALTQTRRELERQVS